jgi:glucose/mannose-6-phosphate isomerase
LEARRDKCRPEVAGAANPAREIARKIGTTIPIFYGGGALGAVAALRWKSDVNENAKGPAFWSAYPELDHNEICGWGQHGDVTRQIFTLVELRHDFEHEELGRRFELTRALIEETLAQVLEVRAEGDGRLAQLLDLMYMGDWTSCYLALDHDVDPGPIDAIFQLKDALGQHA